MTHEWTIWLHDAVRHGRRILELVDSIDLETYRSTEFPRVGVERYLITVGEALRVALRLEPALAERVPDARDAIDLRNVLTHVYMSIEDEIVWKAITVNLPGLIADVEHVIREVENPNNVNEST